MKKYVFLVFCLVLTCCLAFSQDKDKKVKAKKLSKQEKANMTQEQVLAHENDRLTKGGKKKMSTKQKAKVQRKAARAATHSKAAKTGPRPKPKN